MVARRTSTSSVVSVVWLYDVQHVDRLVNFSFMSWVSLRHTDFDMTMSVHWVRNKTTFALERNCSSHGIPARYDKLGADVRLHTEVGAWYWK
jgi:hypothetical protein